MRIETFLLFVVGALLGYRLWLWLREYFRATPVTPDPWDATVAEALNDPGCLPICHRCLAPQKHSGWFCPECGAVVGPYVNLMPYIQLFSEGEVLRNGVSQRMRWSALTITGYLFYSYWRYSLFAPIYWYRLFRSILSGAAVDERARRNDLSSQAEAADQSAGMGRGDSNLQNRVHCVACNASIPEDAILCPRCGWTQPRRR